MPVGPVQVIPIVISELWSNCKYRSILDVGMGDGLYGVLLRRYLESWYQRCWPHEWSLRIEGIEAYGDYVSDVHRHVYNDIHVGDAIKITKSMIADGRNFDVVLMLDVIEHFTKDDGWEMLHLADKLVTKKLIISTPMGYVEQGIMPHVESEKHRSGWYPTDFSDSRIVEYDGGFVATLDK